MRSHENSASRPNGTEDRTKPFNAVERLIIYLVEKYCPFNVKGFKVLIGVIAIVVSITILILGWMSSRKVKEVVTDGFNKQQLVLARHAARQIENNLEGLKAELSVLGLSPSIQYFEKVSISNRMQITFSSIREKGALEIGYIESSGKQTHVVNRDGYHTAHPDPENKWYLDWARSLGNRNTVFTSEVLQVVYGSSYQKLILKMASPVWQVSPDESHPVPKNQFSGVLLFVIDVTELIEKIIKDIKSGKTGYAWVIDNKGLFLYHPETSFIGKNAFEARKKKKPTISFSRINEIQKEKMLKGEEGTSWYISGWHRGREGEMKKLIAYAPIQADVQNGNQTWSVAVAAPVSEVESAIQAIQGRQFLLEAIIILTIVSGGFLLVAMMLKWSSSLKQEVEEKTKELKKSENHCRSLVENADDIIFTVDRHGAVLSMNRCGCHFFKKGPGDIVQHSLASLLPDEIAQLHLKSVREVFETNSSRQLTSRITVSGNEYWLSTNFSGLVDESGKVFSVLGIARNITERKKMEGQMFYTEKLASVGTLAAGVAHEINNPLAIILGFTDLLAEKAPQGSELHELLKTIEKHATNAKRVVENLLSFTRLTEHKVEDVDINKNIEAVLAVVGNTLALNKIVITKKLAEPVPTVKGDRGELQQVLFNIINNAVHAIKGGGTITITTKAVEEGQKVEIQIADTGSGIRKEHRTRMFDPLFTTKKVGEGTGLGLFVSYGIIAKHGGSITFETRTEEESAAPGTTFLITLPAAIPALPISTN